MSDAVLVDTDVFSFLLKGDSRAKQYARHIEAKRGCLSFMTVAELYRWALSRGWGETRRRSLDESLRRYVVLPFDAALAEAWAATSVARARSGRPISCGDCWIAATAIRFQLPLITHNGADFAGINGLTVVSYGSA